MNSIFQIMVVAAFLSLVGSGRSIAAPNKVLPDDLVGAKQPQVAVDPAGTTFVAFGKENSVFVTRSADGGKTFESPTRVGGFEKLALGMRRGPRIVAGKSSLVVSAISPTEGNLYSWYSENDGRDWSEPARINSVARSAREGLQGMAGNEDGLVFSVWLDLRNHRTQLWGARSVDGGKTWAPNIQIYQSPDNSICECCHPSAAVTKDGTIVVIWRNWLDGNRDMYLARSEDAGKTFGSARKLGSGSWALRACPMDGGSLVISSNEVVSVWRRGHQLFATSGNSSETLVSESGTQPIVIRAKTGLKYIWQDRGNLYRKNGTSGARELMARNAGYASATWSQALQRSLVVWEAEGTIYCGDEE